MINIEQMELEKDRQARESLDNYLLETKRKADWKEALLSANNEAANNRSDDDKQFYKLDSSLKKNTAFIKKCKMFSESQRESLIKVKVDLKVQKYLSEFLSFPGHVWPESHQVYWGGGLCSCRGQAQDVGHRQHGRALLSNSPEICGVYWLSCGKLD